MNQEPTVSLAGCPVLDVHCHGWRRDELLALDPTGFPDRVTMMGMCLVSSGLVDDALDGHLRMLTDSTPLAMAMRRRLAARLGLRRES
jgi:hypothetical protein